MNATQPITFQSKRDTWLVVVIWASVVAMGFCIVALWAARDPALVHEGPSLVPRRV